MLCSREKKRERERIIERTNRFSHWMFILGVSSDRGWENVRDWRKKDLGIFTSGNIQSMWINKFVIRKRTTTTNKSRFNIDLSLCTKKILSVKTSRLLSSVEKWAAKQSVATKIRAADGSETTLRFPTFQTRKPTGYPSEVSHSSLSLSRSLRRSANPHRWICRYRASRRIGEKTKKHSSRKVSIWPDDR